MNIENNESKLSIKDNLNITNENVSEYEIITIGNVKYIDFPIFHKYDVKAIYSTRIGGISKGDVCGMNLSYKLDDSYDNVLKNFKILCDAANLNYDNLTMSNQVHGVNVKEIKKENIGEGIHKVRLNDEGIDGILTGLKNVTLVTQYADCIPILLYDVKNKVIASSHGGWKGTVSDIVTVTLKKMNLVYGTNPEDIIAAIGPGIGICCYEVSSDVISAINNLNTTKDNKLDLNKIISNRNVDLKEINRQLLILNGIKSDNIKVCDLCTKCRQDLFFSHRVSGLKRGSQAALIMMKG